MSVRQTATGVEVVTIETTWKYSERVIPGGVVIRFEDGSKVIQFTASQQAGQIKTAVQNLTVTTVAPRPTEEHDDDHDDDHNEDEHDEEEEDDD